MNPPLRGLLFAFFVHISMQNTIIRTDCEQQGSFENSQKGHVLENHVISSLNVRMAFECVVHCLETPACKSINFKRTGTSDNVCELNDKSEEEVALTINPDYTYYGPSKKFQPSDCPVPDLIAACSCLGHLKNDFKTDGYYKIYNTDTNNYLTVYCDMNSEPGAAWTLIESFTFANRGLHEFKRRPLWVTGPVDDKSPNWNYYRMALSQMSHLKSQSTHWRVTCSFPTHGIDYTDYVRAKFTEFDVMTFAGNGICNKVEYINVRGHQCTQCTSQWWQGSTAHAHLDSSSTGCEFKPKEGSVYSEDNFGLYSLINNQFRCTASESSTTNWWFGGYQ